MRGKGADEALNEKNARRRKEEEAEEEEKGVEQSVTLTWMSSGVASERTPQKRVN